MNTNTLEKIDKFAAEVDAELAARAEAVKKLKEIAHRYPDLFEQFASFLANGHEDTTEKEVPLVQPTQAIKEYLFIHPGAVAGDIVAALVDRIETKSENPANIIYSTLGSLERRGKIASETTADGKAYSLRPTQDFFED